MEGPSEHRFLHNFPGRAPRKPALSSPRPHKWSMLLPFTGETAETQRENNMPKVPEPVAELELKPWLFDQVACVAS